MGGTSVADLAVRLIGSLGVVVGLMFLIAKFANKRMGRTKGQALQVVARQGLSKASSVAVVTVGSRVLVLGTTDQQVNVLAELDPEELELTVAAVDPEESTDSPAAAAVPNLVARFAERRTRPTESAVAAHNQPFSGSLLSAQTWKQTFTALKSV